MKKPSVKQVQIVLANLVILLTVLWFISLIVNFRNYNITDPSEIIASLTQFISVSFLLSALSAAGSLVILLRDWPMPHTLKVFKLIVTSISVFCFYYILAMTILSGNGLKYLWLLLVPALTFAEFILRDQDLHLSDTMITIVPGVIAGCLVIRDTGFLDSSLAEVAGAVIVTSLPAMIGLAVVITISVWLASCLLREIVLPDADHIELKRKWIVSLVLPVLGIFLIGFAGILFVLFWIGALLIAAGMCLGIANIAQSFRHNAPHTLFIVISSLVFGLISLIVALCCLNAPMGNGTLTIFGVALLIYAVPGFGAVLLGSLIGKAALYLRQKRLSGKS